MQSQLHQTMAQTANGVIDPSDHSVHPLHHGLVFLGRVKPPSPSGASERVSEKRGLRIKERRARV